MCLLWQVIALITLYMQVPATRHADRNGIERGAGWMYTLRPPINDYVNDFYQEWSSARNWATGRPIYTSQRETIPVYLGVQLDRTRKLNLEYNAHPPSSVLLVLPLGQLAFLDALVVWHVVSLMCFVAGAWLFVRELTIRASWSWAWWILPGLAFLALCNPWRQQFNQGQLNGVLFLLLIGTWIANRRGYAIWSGGLIGVAAAIKIFPGFLLLYLLLRREIRGVVVGLATLGLVMLLTALVLGTQTYRDYVEVVLPGLSQFRCSWVNESVVGFWHRLFVENQSEGVKPIVHSLLIAWAMTGISAVLIIGYVAFKALAASTRVQQDRVFWLFVTAMLLLGPLTWDHSLLLLAPGLFLLIRDSKLKLPPATWQGWLLVVIVSSFWLIGPREAFDALIERGWMAKTAGPLQLVLVISVPFYALLALFFMQAQSIRGKAQ